MAISEREHVCQSVLVKVGIVNNAFPVVLWLEVSPDESDLRTGYAWINDRQARLYQHYPVFYTSGLPDFEWVFEQWVDLL